MPHRSPWTSAAWLMALMLTLAAPLQAQTIETELERAGERLEAARAAHLNLIAPRAFARAEEQLGDARDRFSRGGKIDDIRRRLGEVDRALETCERLQEIGNLTLRDALDAREDALASNAPQFSPQLWADAEETIRGAGQRIEDGDQNGARRSTTKAVDIYRNAELQSIRADVLGRARDQRALAIEAKAEERAPQTLARADQLLSDAERVLQGDRYQRAEAREFAAEATEQFARAARIARDSAALENDRKRAIELAILDYESKLAAIAGAVGFQPRFSEGAGPVTEQILAAVGSIVEDRNGLRQSADGLRQEVEGLEGRLSALSERDAELQLREGRERRLREIRTMFLTDEAEVLLRGDQLIIRLYGLSFPSGSSEIRPANFSLLTKLQRVLREFPRSPAVIEGHTDSVGDDDFNQALSERRARAVREYLLANMTMEADSLGVVGYGESRPIANNETADGRAKNRRIDVVVELPSN